MARCALKSKEATDYADKIRLRGTFGAGRQAMRMIKGFATEAIEREAMAAQTSSGILGVGARVNLWRLVRPTLAHFA